MQIHFDKEAVVSNLPGIILLSHGRLAVGMVDTIRIVIGDTRNVAAFSLESNDDPEEYRKAFLDAVRTFSAGSVIFVDMFGGSPCNQLMMATQEMDLPLCAFSGMNLPLISEAISMREITQYQELRDTITEIIPYAIIDIQSKLEEMEDL